MPIVSQKEASHDVEKFVRLINEMKDVPSEYIAKLRSYLPFIKAGFMTPLNAIELSDSLLKKADTVSSKDKAVKNAMVGTPSSQTIFGKDYYNILRQMNVDSRAEDYLYRHL